MEHFLPKELLNHFDIVSVKKKEGSNPLSGELEIHLDEKNQLHREDRSEYESKGFCPSSRIQDFPIRGNAVYLCIRRRKWRHKNTGKQARNSFDLTTDGTRMTKELSDFLKDAR
jgi:hypothetical protein